MGSNGCCHSNYCNLQGHPIIKIIRIVSLFFSCIIASNLHWDAITSTINPQSVKFSDGNTVIATTHGGIIQFDLSSESFINVSIDTDVYPQKLQSLQIKDSKLFVSDFIGGMQILNIESKNVEKIQHLDFIHSISDINFFDDELFAIGSTINGDGILNFTLYNGEYRYSNFYRSFPSTITKINDLVIVEDEVIISHSDGMYKSNINGGLYSADSWESVPLFDNKMILSMSPNYIIASDGIYLSNGELKLSLAIDSILVSVEDTISNTINWLTETTFYEWSESGLWTYDNPFNEGTNSIHVSYNSMDRWGSLIVLSATNHGVTIINREDNSVKLYIPNSIITNEISALHLDDNGDLYGVGREGGFVKKGSRITNFYAFSKGYSYPNRGDGYNAVKLNYHIGDYFPTAITTINSGNFIFNIYGRKLDVENNSGAVLEVNSNNWSYTLYGDENNIFDGTNGIVDDNSGGLYAQVPQIKKDNNGNSWCVNAFSENFNQPFAIMDNIGEWHHITAPDTDSYLPLDLDFSQNGDVWVAFIRHNNLDGTLVSSGGIKILDYKNTISDSSDDEWHELVSPDILPGGSNQDVYSLVFSETEGQEILWVMTANGVQGYIVNGYNLTPIYPQTFYGNIGITKGDRLKVDPQNNVWVITKHSGVKVIRANTERWPTEEGFTIENSPILSNIVYDVAFSKSGEAYLATHEGISIVHTPFGIEPSDYNTNEILVSPNPVKISESDGVSFFSIPAGSTVKVMTLDGRVVKSFKLAYNESAVNHWNCKLNNGDFLTSGIYYVVSTHPQGGNFIGKFAVIR